MTQRRRLDDRQLVQLLRLLSLPLLLATHVPSMWRSGDSAVCSVHALVSMEAMESRSILVRIGDK